MEVDEYSSKLFQTQQEIPSKLIIPEFTCSNSLNLNLG